MAYDKVVDSAVLDANLKSVANAIRSKGGTSANLEFPTGFVNAIAAIEAGGETLMESYDITIASDLGKPTGNNSIHTILSANAFVKDNYSKDGFTAILVPVNPVPQTAYYVCCLYHGNRNIATTSTARYGFFYCVNSSGSFSNGAMTTKISGTSYNAAFRASSNGNLNLYIANNWTLPAGDYKLYLMMME